MNQVIVFIRTHSVYISEFVRQLMYVGLAFGLLMWDEKQQAVVLSALSALFALFTSKQTIPSNKIDNIVDKAMERSAKDDMNRGRE